MTKFLLTVHILFAILAIGPVAVAASMFPPTARRALADPTDAQALAPVRLLHRICRVYAAVGVAVPVFGFATAKNMGILGDTWIIVSIVLTTVAAGALIALVLPRQDAILTELEATATGGPETATDVRRTVQLAMFTGVFNLLWAVVTVLMILRPGSTTGG
ncbi:DUF2269 family protein [Streptomyces sp. CBMA152]|uniref:DUF2269 family protein n=1 Tax=Streptomyces sp. CBMA152 TaxID=1896312 RepID=UPI00166077EC|nr:DUF2269 family protein [Streptomyces sp. CBMA152]MBD0744990.1 hypothetical protein [Streptomyces sp. CBMA152]